MHSAKIAIEPYVHGVCVHFADLRLGTSELAIEPYVRWVCEQFEHVSKVAKKYVQIPIRRASSSGGTPLPILGNFCGVQRYSRVRRGYTGFRKTFVKIQCAHYSGLRE